MIDLKTARDKADKLADNEMPALSSLRRWISRGLLSGTIDYSEKGRAGGRVGLYPDSIVAEIATVIALKNRYNHKEIVEVRENIISDLDTKQINSKNIKEILKKRYIKLEKLFNPGDRSGPGEMEETENLFRQTFKEKDYLETYQYYIKKAAEVMNQDEKIFQ